MSCHKTYRITKTSKVLIVVDKSDLHPTRTRTCRVDPGELESSTSSQRDDFSETGEELCGTTRSLGPKHYPGVS